MMDYESVLVELLQVEIWAHFTYPDVQTVLQGDDAIIANNTLGRSRNSLLISLMARIFLV